MSGSCVLGYMQTQTTEPQKIFGSSNSGRGRDFELVGFIGRHGVVAIEHVMARLGVREAAAYRRVAACIERGLLERIELLRREPSLIRATRAGLRYAGLGLPVAVVSPGAVDHWLRCATTAQLLAAEFGAERVISERELRPPSASRAGRSPPPSSASCPAATPACTAPTSSSSPSGRVIAIEVELTPKAPASPRVLIRAWRGARVGRGGPLPLRPGPTRRGVERAVAKTYAGARVRILEAVRAMTDRQGNVALDLGAHLWAPPAARWSAC